MRLTLRTLLLLSPLSATAHFLLNYPTTVGFDDNKEGISPCGGFSVGFDDPTDFFVGGDSIALQSTHPAAVWLFRATLDLTAGGNWTDLLPAVSQDALGDFCEQKIMVPSSFAGQKGVLQIVQSATDGLLYQCAAINFKSGANPTVPSACKNVTNLSAAFTSDSLLSTIPASAAETSSSGSTTASGSPTTTGTGGSGSSTAATTSPSATKNAAVGVAEGVGKAVFWSGVLGFGALAVGL